MRIIVIGAGALGSYLAASLSKGGCNVALIARGERLVWLRSHPVEIESYGETTRTRVAVLDWPELVQPVDLAFICTKTPALPQVLEAIGRILTPAGIVVTVQNGVDAPNMARKALPDAAVIASRFHGFFEMDGQLVRHIGVAPSISFGCINGPSPAIECRVANILEKADISGEMSPDIAKDLWKKLMLAASLGGVGAAWGKDAGEIFETANGEQTLRGAMHEVAALADAFNVKMDAAEIDQAMSFARGFPANARTSLQRDLQTGRPSEYDNLIGAIIRMADAEGIQVPLFTELDQLVHLKFQNCA